ncbi:hypothetical protein K4K59_009216 [Colletotrichum sp. SAR11_240]|nr:hypothetical protein K4K59_009216 [Colletotrichum sp. SAR11_240]
MRANILTLAAFIGVSAAQDALTCTVLDPQVDRATWRIVESGNCETVNGLTTCGPTGSSLSSYFSVPNCNAAGTIRVKNSATVRTATQLRGVGGPWVVYSVGASEECTTNLGMSNVTSYINYRFTG